jgi:hypothetical protein
VKKVLLVGFSVSADKNGYAALLKKHLVENPNIEFDYVAIGGIHPSDLCYFCPLLVPEGNFDLVIFEIFTSSYRNNVKSFSEFIWPLASLSAFAESRRAKPVFLNLFRLDVDYDTDRFMLATKRFCEAFDVHLIDLAPSVRSIVNEIGTDQSFVDTVHPRKNVSEAYASAVQDELMAFKQVQCTSNQFDQYLGLCNSIAFASLLPDLPSYMFERSGVELTCVEIDGPSLLTIELGRQERVAGISFLMGPRSGDLVLGGGPRANLVGGYDQYCYYERLAVGHVAPFESDRITLEVLGDLPTASLLKGEADLSSRVARVSSLFTKSRAIDELAIELSAKLNLSDLL